VSTGRAENAVRIARFLTVSIDFARRHKRTTQDLEPRKRLAVLAPLVLLSHEIRRLVPTHGGRRRSFLSVGAAGVEHEGRPVDAELSPVAWAEVPANRNP
jgi:recombinational DNA repair ATPase RecF